jgi:hypothetical protein
MRFVHSRYPGWPKLRNAERVRVELGCLWNFTFVWMGYPIRVGHQIGHTVKDHLKAIDPHIVDVVVHLEPHEAIALS